MGYKPTDMTTEGLTKWIQRLILTGQIHQFYISRPWRKVSGGVRREQNNECQMCKLSGRYSQADVVHHVKELRRYPHLALTESNLMCLCSSCHWDVHHPHNKAVTDERW